MIHFLKPCVPLKNGEEDDIESAVGRVKNLLPHICGQFAHLLEYSNQPFNKLDGVTPLITDPPPNSSIRL